MGSPPLHFINSNVFSNYAKKASDKKTQLENELKALKRKGETFPEALPDNNVEMRVKDVNSDPEMSNDLGENMETDEHNEGNVCLLK